MYKVIFEIKIYSPNIAKITAVDEVTGAEVYQSVSPKVLGTPAELLARQNLIRRLERMTR